MSSFDDDFNQMIFNQDYRKCERYARDLSTWPITKQYVGSILSQVLPARTPCKTGNSLCNASVHAAIFFNRPDRSDDNFSESLHLYMCRHNWYVNYKRSNNFSVSDVLSDDYKTYPMPSITTSGNQIESEVDAIAITLIEFAKYIT